MADIRHDFDRNVPATSAIALAVAVLVFGLAAMPGGALAQDAVLPTSGPGTIVTLGGYGLIEPKFEGAKHQEFAFRPIIGFRAPDKRQWLDLPNDGLDYELIETDNFRAGPVGNIRFSRDTDSLVRGFKRIRDVNVSVEAGGFAEYWPADWLRTRAEVRGAFFGADGVVADLSSDLVLHPMARWTATLGARVSFADQEFMDSYYTITPSQSVSSGLGTYHAAAGLRSYGAGTSLRYQWSDAWTTMGFVEYNRLAHNAADSPLIDDRGSADMFTVGIGAKYSFHVDW